MFQNLLEYLSYFLPLMYQWLTLLRIQYVLCLLLDKKMVDHSNFMFYCGLLKSLQDKFLNGLLLSYHLLRFKRRLNRRCIKFLNHRLLLKLLLGVMHLKYLEYTMDINLESMMLSFFWQPKSYEMDKFLKCLLLDSLYHPLYILMCSS